MKGALIECDNISIIYILMAAATNAKFFSYMSKALFHGNFSWFKVFRYIVYCRFVADFMNVTVYNTVSLAFTRAVPFFYQELLFNSSDKTIPCCI